MGRFVVVGEVGLDVGSLKENLFGATNLGSRNFLFRTSPT